MSIIGIDIGSSTTKVIEYKNEEIKNKLITALSAKYKSYDVISNNLSIDQLIGYINSLDGYDFSFSFNIILKFFLN